MDGRVLVAYASKHGATAEIAEKIGEALKAPVGDFRDWDVIASWAEDITAALKT